MDTTQKTEENFDFTFNDEYREGEGDFSLEKGTILDLSEITSQEQVTQAYSTTIRVNGKDYPVLVKETPAYLARHILNHSKLHGFTLVTFIGKSGTGKSTLTGTLTHYLHTMAEKKFGYNYVPLWYKKRDIENIDNIIAGLEKGINRIMIFEDASFTFNYSDTAELEEIMARLTYIRHTLQAKVIIMIQIHYTKALEKFLRDGDVKIITSMSDEEKDNFLRLFGYEARNKIRYFANKYHSMETNGYWYADASMTKVFYYKTQEPFRLGLVSDFGKLHNIVYHPVDCEKCRPNYDAPTNVMYDTMTMDDFLRQLGQSYTPGRLRTCLKNVFYFREGLDVLEPRMKYIVHRLNEYFHNHPKDYEALKAEIASGKSVDLVLRQRGLLEGGPTHEERRKARNMRDRRGMARRRESVVAAAAAASPEVLEAAGVASMNPGPMSDEEIGRDTDERNDIDEGGMEDDEDTQ